MDVVELPTRARCCARVRHELSKVAEADHESHIPEFVAQSHSRCAGGVVYHRSRPRQRLCGDLAAGPDRPPDLVRARHAHSARAAGFARGAHRALSRPAAGSDVGGIHVSTRTHATPAMAHETPRAE